jgi:hypothetical protein
MNRKKTDRRPGVVECLIVAVLVVALAATGWVAVGFGVQDLFASLRFPQ